jgi:hypothetical protein
MTATAKVIQRLEPNGAIRSRLIPDFATLMLITRFAPDRPNCTTCAAPGRSGMSSMIRAPHRSTVFSAA